MPETDAELLQDFTQNRSQVAFSRLVERYSDLVFAAARRQIADSATAEDITQAAFLLLARKSASVKPDRLPAWLLTTTRLCAKQAIRTRIRRTHHEQEAAMTKSETIPPAEIPDPHLTAVLDDAMSRLPSRVCTAIAMRHLQNRPVNDVATSLGVSPDAAQKILARGLAKLRRILTGKGVTLSSVAVLTGAMLHESAQRAPAALLISPNNPTAASLAIARGALNMMLWTSIKIATAAIAAMILITSAGSIAVFKSLVETTAHQSVVQSPPAQPTSAQPLPIQPTANATAAPYTAAPFNSPFIQLVGCRIKVPITLKLAPKPSEPSNFFIAEQQRPVLQWTIDPALAPRASTYKISIAKANDPASAYTISAGKLVTEQPIGPQINYPGDYDVTITALTADSHALASAQSHIVVKPLPTTGIVFGDVQADGSIRLTIIVQGLNPTSRPMPPDVPLDINVGGLKAEHIVDDNGASLRFTASHEGNLLHHRVFAKTPIQPGDAILMALTGTQTAALRQLPNGVFQYSATEQSGSNAPTRRIQLFRLPAGATLLHSSDNLSTRDVDGQTQLYMDTVIPPGGAIIVEFRYCDTSQTGL